MRERGLHPRTAPTRHGACPWHGRGHDEPTHRQVPSRATGNNALAANAAVHDAARCGRTAPEPR
eukprot:925344-Lingulodinium_polyedra.AAC.1